ncbi:FMN-binding protein [Clostridium sp. OS1-26]|uniref:FMN-binding protein n=1 Tax=Clostridium sp. OS1-26 TaxID=3070681 RepID=UPI0027DEF3B0|nr:FMN-binding protein [Clostridium sp. OS1-26]WML37013.1 4Fe-4S binding protein [Clostridium sp. OS1-26]
MANLNRKISKIQIIRSVVQLLGLILFPGTFILAFSEIRDIYLAILSGKLNFYQVIPKSVELITIIPITIILGRFFCGWLCAFGTFNDFIYIISTKVFKIKFKVNEKLDSILKSLKYILLLFIIYFIWTKGSTLFETSSPWDAFAQIPNFSDAVSQYTIGLIFLVFILIGATFIERFFCRYLCPLGAVFAVTSKIRIFDILKKKDKCGNCRLCTNNCSMGIQMYKHDKIKSGECINCFKCIDACPRKNTKAEICGEHVSPMLATCVAIGGFTVLYSGTNFASKDIPTASISKNIQRQTVDNLQTNNNVSNSSGNSVAAKNSSSTNNQQQKYKDGVYTGIGRGYRPNLEVEVTIKDGKIADIQIASNNETPRFAEEPFSIVPNEIIQAQSTKVDGVSGATRSSNGIKQAVEDALSKARM